MKKHANYIFIIVFMPSIGWASGCDLGAHFGPVSFENERPVAALRKILTGTGISLIESGEFNAGTISAQNVSGTVGEAVRRLAEGTGLDYSCNNGVMRVAQKPHAAPLAATPTPLPVTTPPPVISALSTPVKSIISIRNGDSIRARLTRFAQENQYQISWSGDDLFAKKNANFIGDSFEDVINKFFIATRITGYITKDEGKMLNVFVQ